MAAGFAELERNMIAERTTQALAHKKAHREAYGPPPGIRPGRQFPGGKRG